LRADGSGADAFGDGKLGEDCVHGVLDELLASHALRGGYVDDVEVSVEEEYRVGERVDDVYRLDQDISALYLDPSFRFRNCIRTIV